METARLIECFYDFDHVVCIEKDSGVKVIIVFPYGNNTRRKIPDWIESLSATTVEMLDHGFFKSYDDLYEVSNDGSALDRMSRGIRDPLKNKVSSDIPEDEKDPFVDSNASPQQREELMRWAKIMEPTSGDGLNGILSEGIINSPPGLGEYLSIDIPSVLINQQWKEYISGELDRKKRDYSMISESTLAIAGQAVGALLSSTFSGSSSKDSWTANFVASATVLGVGFTLSGIGLRRVKLKLSGIMNKLGAVATASAIILALGSTVVPAVAWTAGAVACLLISVGVAMA